MSLSLQESCQLYERFCRRQKLIPTFAAFNQDKFTCLPENAEIEASFKSVLLKARKAYGMPVTRRLPSLYHKLSGIEKPVSTSQPSAVVVSSEKAFVYDNDKYESAMSMNIRPPNCISPTEELKEDDLTLEEYKEMVQNSPLKEAKGLIVHLVPQKRGEALSSLACKLTKKTWDALRGKKDIPVKMKDGSEMNLNTVRLDVEDVRNFVNSRKRKEDGPYFLRFSRI